MSFRLQQSTASQVVMFMAFLSTDHVSVATSQPIAITISKNGAAFGNPNAGATNATELANGWYKVTLDATDTATVGSLAIRGTASGVDDVGLLCHVESPTSGGSGSLTALVNRSVVKLNEATLARRRVLMRLLDSTDGSAKTGIDIAEAQLKVSKNGAAEANMGGVWTEISGGLYHYELATGELDTVGFVSLRINRSGIQPFVKDVQVVSFDPYDAVRLGLTALPNAAAEAAGGLITRGTGTGQLSVSSGAVILQNPQGVKKNTALAAFEFPMFNSSGSLVTGEFITAERSIDGAAFGACTNAAAEVGATGIYKIDLSAADLNGDFITLKFTSALAKPSIVGIKTVVA